MGEGRAQKVGAGESKAVAQLMEQDGYQVWVAQGAGLFPELRSFFI